MSRFTKRDAAGANLDAAIAHFLAGDWVPAIHCAGAAEEVCGRLLQRLGRRTVADSFWEDIDFTDLVETKQEFIKYANSFRDWIKHVNANDAAEMDIEQSHALFLVTRAAVSYGRLLESGEACARPSLEHFGQWLHANKDRIEEDINAMPD